MRDALRSSLDRPPRHLWIVGGLALVWNAFGAFDYLMTQTRNDAYMSAFTDAQLEFFYGMPAWVDAAWAIGVWAGVLGCVLLLLRSRFAVWAFAVSLAGLVVTSVQNYFMAAGLEVMGGPVTYVLVAAVFVIAVALLVYARHLHRRRVLR